jgi:microcompartment protein PduM
MNTERLVQLILERLLEWEKTSVIISSSEIKGPDCSLLLRARNIRIQGVDQGFLQRLESGEDTSFKEWFHRAYSYGANIQLELFDCGEPWLCYEQLRRVNYAVFSAENKQLNYVEERLIAYQDVAMLPPNSVLCKYQKQRFTSLAIEHLRRQQITIQERK